MNIIFAGVYVFQLGIIYLNSRLLQQTRSATMADEDIHVEVSGVTYTLNRKKLEVLDSSILISLFESPREMQCFNRSRSCFEAILQFSETGELHLPRNVCPNEFRSEAKFWGVDMKNLSRCCRINYNKFMDNFKELEEYSQEQINDDQMIDSKGSSKLQLCRRKVWEVLDLTYSSAIAKVTEFNIFSDTSFNVLNKISEE